MKSLCIIPARGGSKRIPRKNVKAFCGKPIISYSIEVAINSGLFDEIMVSTEDKEVAEISRQYGAKIPFFRTEKNADDFATTADVLEEVILEYERLGQYFDNVCCIYPTAPLVSKVKLAEGFQKLKSSEIQSVFPVTKFEYPIWRGFSMDPNCKMEMLWKEHLNSRSQDLQPVFHDVGQWYWIKTKSFLVNKKLFSDNSIGIQLSALEVQDIDNPTDWKLAELKYELLQRSK